jgi:phosphatidylinositol dimannoside acyltransferase
MTAGPAPEPPANGATVGQRLVTGALIGGVRLLRLLPEGVVYRGAFGLGVALSFVLRGRRRLLRANLARVVAWLDANGMANPRTAAAARDGRALDGLVRAAFGHWVTTYAEVARAAGYDAPALRARVRLETPEAVASALGPVAPGEPGRIYVGLHFGAVELAGLYAARTGEVPIGGPMETVANPALQAYFTHARESLGAEVIPVRNAAVLLRDRLDRGLGVALVADRVIGGTGTRVQLFGAPARLPAGPAFLAVESGARLCFISLRRDDRLGRWVGRVDEVPVPVDGGRRERVRSVIDDHARWIERTVATAPEQWWTLLFPIWEDIT